MCVMFWMFVSGSALGQERDRAAVAMATRVKVNVVMMEERSGSGRRRLRVGGLWDLLMFTGSNGSSEPPHS